MPGVYSVSLSFISICQTGGLLHYDIPDVIYYVNDSFAVDGTRLCAQEKY